MSKFSRMAPVPPFTKVCVAPATLSRPASRLKQIGAVAPSTSLAVSVRQRVVLAGGSPVLDLVEELVVKKKPGTVGSTGRLGSKGLRVMTAPAGMSPAGTVGELVQATYGSVEVRWK